MARYKHILWDWNGTLLNDVQACAEAINILLERRAMAPLTLEQYLDVFDFPVRNYYLKLGFDFSQDNWDDVAREYHQAYARTSAQSDLRQGTQTVLEQLRRNGIGNSVLSACELGMLKRMMAERHILESFKHIYGLSHFHAHSKVELGLELLHHTGLAQADIILVGDTTHDHEVAQAMGIPCLLVTGGHQAESKLVNRGCPVLPDLDRVLHHLLG